MKHILRTRKCEHNESRLDSRSNREIIKEKFKVLSSSNKIQTINLRGYRYRGIIRKNVNVIANVRNSVNVDKRVCQVKAYENMRNVEGAPSSIPNIQRITGKTKKSKFIDLQKNSILSNKNNFPQKWPRIDS